MEMKTLKVTNRDQFDKLLAFLEKHPHIAKGVRRFSNRTQETRYLWSQVAIELNDLGPPMRSALQWRRVWIHYKGNLKRKFLQNQNKIPSPFERRVIKLINATDIPRAGQSSDNHSDESNAEVQLIDCISMDSEEFSEDNNQDQSLECESSSSLDQVSNQTGRDSQAKPPTNLLNEFNDSQFKDKRYEIFGQNVSLKLRELTDNTQRILAEKLINDALFMAETGQLTMAHSICKSRDLEFDFRGFASPSAITEATIKPDFDD